MSEKRAKLRHFEEEDVLHVLLKEGEEATSVEIAPNITAELNEQGELIGVEILNATRFLTDVVLESVQAKILELREA